MLHCHPQGGAVAIDIILLIAWTDERRLHVRVRWIILLKEYR